MHDTLTHRSSRLAPSPTGALHLGNARTFLVNWAMARRAGWRLVMRIEDLDGPRVKPAAVRDTLDVLRWLGLDHDGEVLIQSHDLEPYRRAMHRLAELDLVYPCSLTRRQIEQAVTAPHDGDRELRFAPELRPAAVTGFSFDREDTNYRLRTSSESIRIADGFAGESAHDPHEQVGDFVVWTRRGVPAYQLAVVVDDIRHAISDVVRGVDLLPSAARQTLLYRGLDTDAPRWWHLPLVVGTDGRRLAKRHGDTRIDAYRQAGVPAEAIVGLLAWWSGLTDRRVPLSAADFRDRFDPATLSRDTITFTEDDHAWLLGSR